MEYVGLQEQITSNNRKSTLLLIGFPTILLAALYSVILFLSNSGSGVDLETSNRAFIGFVPYVLIFTGIWFTIAYLGHSSMINYATGAKTLERKDNMRVYNLTENLCMSVGMKMPKLKIIENNGLNAFASGLNEKNHTVTLTRGIIDTLEDDELEGVIAHELMHIRNNDVRLLIISIIFVGIFSFILQIAFRSFLFGGGRSSRKKDGKGGAAIIIVVIIASVIAYLISLLFKFALSRKREYLADAGAAEMTKNPLGLANALRKISGNSQIGSIQNNDVKEMFIENGPDKKSSGIFSSFSNMFSTHPPIDERIRVLEQF
ncbi:MAG: M48 family metallopeptidase [Crocinitomicaceae bacterium]|jgi:heat shock protein HtpX|tara:strand:- start:10000 stop:10953 length:954 start_codon:yes stop_codon:yes gene_type:complete